MLDADRALRQLSWAALWFAVAGIAGWALLQAAELAGADQLGQALAALGPVLLYTQFGHLVLLQAGALGLTFLLLRITALRSATIAAMADVAAQAGHGHAMAMGGVSSVLFWAGTLHLLAASAWLGGLLALLIMVRLAPFRAACLAARWFSPLGKWCVGVLAGSALLQGWRLVGSIRALFETPYGWMILVKTGCFGLLLGLAILNRYHLAPALMGDRPDLARRRLSGSIVVQTGAGALAVLAAGLLSGFTPGMDLGRTS